MEQEESNVMLRLRNYGREKALFKCDAGRETHVTATHVHECTALYFLYGTVNLTLIGAVPPEFLFYPLFLKTALY